MSLFVKICGVTSVEDAKAAADLGAGAVGVNFVDASKRRVDVSTARSIVAAVGDRIEVVGVVAGLSVEEMRELIAQSGVHALQLHGDESPEALSAMLPNAFKVLRIGSSDDVAGADAFDGSRLMVDAKVGGALGGTGETFDWRLVVDLAQRRSILLAGGLNPENVVRAVGVVRPHGVDVASGVEVDGDPRSKDHEKVRAFIEAAKAARQGSEIGQSSGRP